MDCQAEAAGDPGPWRQQAILGRGRWNADDLRDIVRDDALGLLIRRNIADGDLAFFSTWCPAGTAIETLIRIRERLS